MAGLTCNQRMERSKALPECSGSHSELLAIGNSNGVAWATPSQGDSGSQKVKERQETGNREQQKTVRSQGVQKFVTLCFAASLLCRSLLPGLIISNRTILG